MSRFVEIMNEWRQKPISSLVMKEMLTEALVKMESDAVQLEIKFKYFIEKTAPSSGMKSLLDVDCTFAASLTKEQEFDFVLGVEAPYTSLCPCSKEISLYGAHNQRGTMAGEVRYAPDMLVWVEDLVELMESQASSPVYSLLKRQDEKYVTEAAYDNPQFVEDIIRDMVLALRAVEGVRWFSITCENQESIHNHNAYARHSEVVTR